MTTEQGNSTIEQILYLITRFTDALSYGERKPDDSRCIKTELYDDEISLLIIALAEKLQREIDSPEKKGGQDDSSTILP